MTKCLTLKETFLWDNIWPLATGNTRLFTFFQVISIRSGMKEIPYKTNYLHYKTHDELLISKLLAGYGR